MDHELQEFEATLRRLFNTHHLEGGVLPELLGHFKYQMANYALAAVMDSAVRAEAEAICSEGPFKYIPQSNLLTLRISVGHEGPTDCCYVLSDGHKSKQFGVESDSWNRVARSYSGDRNLPKEISPGMPSYQDLASLLYNEDTTADEF